MNTHAKHILIKSDVPIFGTGPDPIRWYASHPEESRKKKHDKEDHQIDDRWLTFEFKHSFKGNDRISDVHPCPACFVRLAYLGYDD